jgi:hypothetical protein
MGVFKFTSQVDDLGHIQVSERLITLEQGDTCNSQASGQCPSGKLDIVGGLR